VDDFDLADCPVVAQRGDVSWSHAECFSLIDIGLCQTGRLIIGVIPKNVHLDLASRFILLLGAFERRSLRPGQNEVLLRRLGLLRNFSDHRR
jgi:hypothetical protein